MRNIKIYRDFGHHPEAVAQTIKAMRPLARGGKLLAAYEPRSATACRKLHEREYEEALSFADSVVLAPVGRPEIPEEERLDTVLIAKNLRSRGVSATAARSLEEVAETLEMTAQRGDLILLFSNGHFGHIDQLLLSRLGAKQ